MSGLSQDFAHRKAVKVYGAFLDECIERQVIDDRDGPKGKESAGKIDGRPVRLVTISGKGGWSPDPALAERWEQNDNISLLDHLLSVARGSLMFWLADAPRSWSSEANLAEIERLAYAVVCIAFLHDVDKDLGLPRGEEIDVADVEERMRRYGIGQFLAKRRIHISPAAMLNYIEEVEGTQADKSPLAPDYDRGIAKTCRYVELADKLEGQFTSTEGVNGVLSLLERWPVLQDGGLKQWEKVEIHDHLHAFLLDHFQRALSTTCKTLTGRLPLIEIVHDGRLLCVIPREYADDVKKKALDSFLGDLPYGLRFAVNNRLACKFVGGEASWKACRDVMDPKGNWDSKFINLLALPKPFARDHLAEINMLFNAAGMTTSWSSFDGSADAATVKPALNHPEGDGGDLDMEPAHALAFLVITLNHTDSKLKGAAPDTHARAQELLCLMQTKGKKPPPVVESAEKDRRAYCVLLALWAIGEIWQLAEEDPDSGQELRDAILGRDGRVGLWLEGDDSRTGLSCQIEDVSSAIVKALSQRFEAYLSGHPAMPFDGENAPKCCILCNEPVSSERKVNTASRAHGIKASAFSGRDGRNDHLASPSSNTGDTHLCPVCLAELQLRQNAQDEFRENKLPPLVSSPVSMGLFGGLAFEREAADKSMGLHDLNRLEIKKGSVYHGLDCQTQRIRVARLETLPNTDKELVIRLHMVLKAIRRLGRPIHIFRGAPRRHPAIFYSDALPAWLERLLCGDSLRIEQLPDALSKLELFEKMAEAPGLGIEWAKQLADPTTKLGALCVAWALAVDRLGHGGNKDQAWSLIEEKTREQALAHIRKTGGEQVNLKDNQEPLIRLAWLATRIQKRIGIGASANKQLLCWKTALEFYPSALGSTSRDKTALILGLAGTLEEELTRKGNAAAKKHRDGQPLDQACIEFATHFACEVWRNVFKSKEPTSQEKRRAAAIYRFALLEAYRERGIPEAENGAPTDDETQEV